MTLSTYLASSLVMGLVAAVVIAFLVKGRRWESYSPGGEGPGGLASQLARDSRLWIFGFVVLILAATAGTIAVLESAGSASLVVFAAGGLAILGFLTIGIYLTARSRGHPHSHAVGEVIAVLGGVAILAIVGNLLTSFGA